MSDAVKSSESHLILEPKFNNTRNAQLGDKEKTCVYFSTATGRILGFGHESMSPMYKESWNRKLLNHAPEIDYYANLYRKQEEEDIQREDFERTEREAPARAAIRTALRARRSVVDGANRQYIDMNLALMENRENRARRRRQTAYLLCEKYEGDPRPEDIALDSPAFRERS